jgi:hypothetical protein
MASVHETKNFLLVFKLIENQIPSGSNWQIGFQWNLKQEW